MLTANQATAALLDALAGQINAAGKQDDYCSVTVQSGNAVVFDFGPESGCGGTAWVRLVTVSPSAQVGKNGCSQWLNYIIEVGMVAPAPGLDITLDQYTPPSDEELFDASMRAGEEMMMIFRAVQSADLEEVTLGDYTPHGPDGGVLGGSWTVTVAGG